MVLKAYLGPSVNSPNSSLLVAVRVNLVPRVLSYSAPVARERETLSLSPLGPSRRGPWERGCVRVSKTRVLLKLPNNALASSFRAVWVHCVLFIVKIRSSHNTSLHKGVKIGTGE